MNLCYLASLYKLLLNMYAEFGPERPDLTPDPAFDYLVSSSVEFDKSQKMWIETPGGEEMKVCFIHSDEKE